MEKKIKILTSWDDGDKLDLTLCDLLTEYRIPAVFYIPNNHGLTQYEIKRMVGIDDAVCPLCHLRARLFEIGAHTMTHPREFQDCTDDEIVREVAGSKAYLENLLKKPVTKFCYPRGRFNDRIKEVVKNCGFKEARTTSVMHIDFPKDSFITHPSIHVYPDRKEYNGKAWSEIAVELFNKVIKEGGRFELWGHSWEVEKYNMWEFLEDFFAYMNDELKKINYPRKI